MTACMDDSSPSRAGTWRTTHGDMTDEEWELVGDFVEPHSSRGPMGRPVTNSRRDVVNAIFDVAATGCQWRALPASYPHWNTVHRYHLRWSRDGTWEQICDRLGSLVRVQEGREPEPSGSVIGARSVRGAATVTTPNRGFDAGKTVSGRKTFGVVDTLGLSSPSSRHRRATTPAASPRSTGRGTSRAALGRCSAPAGSSRPPSRTAPGRTSRPRS